MPDPMIPAPIQTIKKLLQAPETISHVIISTFMIYIFLMRLSFTHYFQHHIYFLTTEARSHGDSNDFCLNLFNAR